MALWGLNQSDILVGSSPEEFARQVKADFVELEALVQKARIKFN